MVSIEQGDAVGTVPVLGGEADNVVLSAVAGESLEVAGDWWLLGAEFVRSGPDLRLLGADGHTVLVRDFFVLENPPDLTSENGQTISAQQVIRLAGPASPSQYAQAGPIEAAQVAQADIGEPIGSVETLEGKVDVIRADGTKVVL